MSQQDQDRALAKKLGVAESTIRARRSRGRPLDAPRQVRLTKAQQQRIARAAGTTVEVAAKYGVSVSTVKRLRRVHRAAAPVAKATQKSKPAKKASKAKKKAGTPRGRGGKRR